MTCSDECALRRKVEMDRLRPSTREARKRRRHERRAVEYGAGSERFDRLEVFERDGWVCGICDGPVDRELAYPDPMCASLDHVVPLARGGEHTRANTRCSHLVCNIRRGADQEHDARGRFVAVVGVGG